MMKMNTLKDKKTFALFQSIKIKILLMIWAVALLSISIVSITNYIFSKNQIDKEIKSKMGHHLAEVTNNINSILIDHSRIPAGLARVTEALGNKLSEVQYVNIIKKYLKMNKSIFGAGIWFEKYKYLPNRKYFGPYVYKDKGKFVFSKAYETDKYDYPKWDWYKMGKTKNLVAWSLPYYDKTTDTTMITCTAPFYKRNGSFWGVTTGDVLLDEIQKIIGEIKIGKAGFSFLLAKDGSILAHPDKKIIMKDKITKSKNKTLAILSKKMLSGVSGQGFFEKNGKTFRVYYSKIAQTNWILALTLSESELYSSLHRMLFRYAILLVLIFIIAGVSSFMIASSFAKPIIKLKDMVETMGHGDLAVVPEYYKVEDDQIEKNEIKLLRSNFQELAFRLRGIIKDVAATSYNLVSSASEMSSTLESFAQNSQSQAAAAEQVTATIEEVSAGVDQIQSETKGQNENMDKLISFFDELSNAITNMGDVIKEVSNHSMQISNNAKSGEESMHLMNDSMSKIATSSNAMTGIIDVITGISEQINLLSLNAAIEAARAGDAGKGFAVVADEISKLAEQTSSSIKEINTLIVSNENEITLGTENVINSINQMSTVINGVSSITETIKKMDLFMNDQLQTRDKSIKAVHSLQERTEIIKNSIMEEKTAMDEIVKSIASINGATQINASGAEEMTATAQEVSSLAEELKSKIDYFKI